MEINRHVRRRMKLYKITREDMLAVMAAPREIGQDEDGNPFYDGVVGDRVIRVVIRRDNPSMFKTTFPRRK